MNNNLKTFYLKYKPFIAMSVLTALVLLANFVYETWFIASAFALLFCATSSFEDNLCYVVFMAVFSGVSPIYASTILSCLLVTVIRYVIDVKNNKKPVFVWQLVLTASIIVLFSLFSSNVNVEGFFHWGLFVGLLMFSYLAFVYADEINVKKAFNFLFYAVVSSVILGLFLYLCGLLKTQIYPFDGMYKRLRLFSLNVNHLAMFCMFGIAYEIQSLVNSHITQANGFKFFKDKDFWVDAMKIVVFSVVGVMTLSKAFLLVFAFVLIYFVICLICRLKLKSLVLIVPAFCLMVIVCVVFKGTFRTIISRFSIYNEWGTLMSKIFTGRTSIWFEYGKEIFRSFQSLLFGAGLLSPDLIEKGAHNVLIHLFYRVGIVGVSLLCVLVWLYFKHSKNKIKITLESSLLFFVYIIFSLEEMIFSDRFFLFLVFSLVILSKTGVKNNKKIDENFEKKQTTANNS